MQILESYVVQAFLRQDDLDDLVGRIFLINQLALLTFF